MSFVCVFLQPPFVAIPSSSSNPPYQTLGSLRTGFPRLSSCSGMEGQKEGENLHYHIQQLEHERDELKRDIEQLCLQQGGPGFLAAATKMHFQRMAALEQEIESLKKKLAGCLRDKKNLEEELSEAYHIKNQLADLHAAEVLKNKEAEKQVKYFQCCVAGAFAERDNSLMEYEKAKEQEEAMSKMLNDCERRLEELGSAYLNEKELNTSLQMELSELKRQQESLEKVANKFYEIRGRNTGLFEDYTLEDKCTCLLDDSSDNWVFETESQTPTSEYIASLEQEKDVLKSSLDKLRLNLRMGVQVEQHLKSNLRSLEKKQMVLDTLVRNGLSSLRNFLAQKRFEVVQIMEEEESHMKAIVMEIQKKSRDMEKIDDSDIPVHREKQCYDTECRDVHISTDLDSSVAPQSDDHTRTVLKSTTDAQDALAQALQEKVAALLLLSQEEERYLVERNQTLSQQQKFEELLRSLSQVTNEKVEALMQLATLKRENQLLKEKNFGHKHGDTEKPISIQEEGKLKNIFKKTYLSIPYWNKQSSSMDFARLKVEYAALQETVANLEHLTNSVHRLRLLLSTVQDDSLSSDSSESKVEALSHTITEANQMKTALVGSLPVSWLGDGADTIADKNPDEPFSPSEASESKKVDPVSAAGMEMVELLIFAADLQKEKLSEKLVVQ